MRRFTYMLLCLTLTFLCNAQVKRYKVEVLQEYPHDTKSYTQGLFFEGGQLYESTGQYGESTFRKVDIATGEALERLDFAKKYFIEGSCVLNGKLYILTWTNKLAFVYDFASMKYEASYSYPREGWGLTTDGQQLIASDGSSNLIFMDEKFRLVKRLKVTLKGRPIRFLNELEYIDGRIWANVYTTDMILIIDPSNANVEAVVDCSGILPKKLRTKHTDVLNGIAHYDGHTYITGKYWPRLYEIKLVEQK